VKPRKDKEYLPNYEKIVGDLTIFKNGDIIQMIIIIIKHKRGKEDVAKEMENDKSKKGYS